MAGPIRIGVIVDAAKARSEFNSTADAADNTGSRMSKLGDLGRKAAAGLAVGAVAAGVALVGMTKAAIADEAAQVKLANALKNNAGATDVQVRSTESWITAQGKAFGVTDDELRPALGRLVTATKDVGQAQKLTRLAMDVSAGSGKSLESVTTALMKAQNGQVSSLSKLGINTKNAAGETITMEQATKRMADQFGGQAAAKAGTLEGKMAILRTRFDEAKETIGAKLIPILTRLADFILTDAMPAVGRFGDFLKDNEGKVKVFAGVFGVLVAALIAASIAMKIQAAGLLIYNGAMLVVRATTAVWTGVQWALNAALTANPIGLVVVAIVALVAIIVIAWKRSETFRDIVTGAWGAIKSATGAAFDWVRDKISAVFDFLKGLFLNFTGPGLIIKHWDTIKDKTRAAWDAVKGFVTDKLAAVRDTVANVGSAIRDRIAGAWDAVKARTSAAWDAVKEFIRGRLDNARDNVVNVLTTIRERIGEAWDTVKTRTAEAWDRFREIIREKIQAAVDLAIGFKDRVLRGFENIGTTLYDVGKRLIQGLIDGISDMFGSVKSKLGELTGKLTEWKGPRARDRKLLTPTGRLIIDGFIRGLEDRFPDVRDSLRTLTSDVAGFGGTLDLTAGGGAVAAFDAALTAESSRSISVRLTAEQVSALQRGREIQADLDVARAAGVRVAAR